MESRRKKSDCAIVAIGVFKLTKSVLLLALGVALIRWHDQDLGAVASQWVNKIWLSHAYVGGLISKLSLMSKETIDRFALGSFVYSGLLLIEGGGLSLRKRWAEYLTVGITASLLPFELYELSYRVTWTGVSITLANLAILGYLIVRLFRDDSAS
jgi:uncharacterized membrane protein (DUF2068 family)